MANATAILPEIEAELEAPDNRYTEKPTMTAKISAFLWTSSPRESRRKGQKGFVKSTRNQPLWR